jgi:hypothetical protein
MRQTKTVFIDEDVTWRDDAVRRLLADLSAAGLIFTDAGVIQVTNAPELKELTGPRTSPADAYNWVRIDKVERGP